MRPIPITPPPAAPSSERSSAPPGHGPGDFAAIYNVTKLWSPASGTPIDGTGPDDIHVPQAEAQGH